MSKFLSDFFYGVKMLKKSFSFIKEHHLYRYFWIPALVSFLLLVGLIGFFMWLVPYFDDLLAAWIPIEESGMRGGNLIEKALRLLADLMLIITAAVSYYFLYKYIILIVLSPFLAFLSEKTEHILTGKEYPFSWGQLLKDAWRGIKMTLLNLVKELSLTIPLLLLGFVPTFGVVTTPILFLVGSYFVGFSLIDLFYERRKLSVSESSIKIKEQRGLAVACGMFFNLLLLVPVVGVLFSPAFSAIGATLAVVEREENLVLSVEL